MTLPAATSQRPHADIATLPRAARSVSGGARPATSAMAQVPMRSYEIVALRPDGSIFIGQQKAPAISLFEAAFSAFARGTMISTSRGDVPVEDLQPGEQINIASGGTSRMMWIGCSTFVPADAGRRIALTRAMADSFGEGRPSGFVTGGPAARIVHTPHHLRADVGEQRLLTPLRELVDGVNVIRVVPPTPVRLFHFCLEQHATVIAGGLEMESFHPGPRVFDGVSEVLKDRFLQMFPHISDLSDFGPLAFPRAPDPLPNAAAS